MDVSFPCVGGVIDQEFRQNIVKVAVDPVGDSHKTVTVVKVVDTFHYFLNKQVISLS